MLQFGGSPRIGGFYRQETPGSRLALSASGCRSSILRGDTPVFAPGFGIQRVLNDLERLSRAMFPIWAKECSGNLISQDYLRYRWLLRYVGRVKTRWGGWGLIGKRRLGCPSPYQAAQAYGAYYLE